MRRRSDTLFAAASETPPYTSRCYPQSSSPLVKAALPTLRASGATSQWSAPANARRRAVRQAARARFSAGPASPSCWGSRSWQPGAVGNHMAIALDCCVVNDKQILSTGATNGIGLAAAEVLAAQDSRSGSAPGQPAHAPLAGHVRPDPGVSDHPDFRGDIDIAPPPAASRTPRRGSQIRAGQIDVDHLAPGSRAVGVKPFVRRGHAAARPLRPGSRAAAPLGQEIKTVERG
jgi:hypothetical protein